LDIFIARSFKYLLVSSYEFQRLHDELMAFADWISPTQKEHETRQMVIHLIRKAIVNQWPDADVHAFGSQNTQLYMPQG
jgi:non-canonical poly(A) RNA polymerase PAPD5/7